MNRSMLFVPGSVEKMIAKAPTSKADALIFDLEDSVSLDKKDVARKMVREALDNLVRDMKPVERPTLIVRVNPPATEYFIEDLREILQSSPDLIMTPKVSQPKDVELLLGKIEEISPGNTVGVMPLIETALGLENAFLIASCSPRVKAMLLGAEDLTADLRCKRTKEGEEILYARSRIVAAGRAAGVDIFDTPFTDTRDEEGIEKDAAKAKSLGFTGKAAITPRHVEVINRVFSPSPEEIEYAQAVLAAIEEGEREGRGAVSLNGKMIDAPVVERAKQVLELAKELD